MMGSPKAETLSPGEERHGQAWTWQEGKRPPGLGLGVFAIFHGSSPGRS